MSHTEILETETGVSFISSIVYVMSEPFFGLSPVVYKFMVISTGSGKGVVVIVAVGVGVKVGVSVEEGVKALVAVKVGVGVGVFVKV